MLIDIDTMAVAVSPPATPEASRAGIGSARPQSMYAPTISPETTTRSRPQSMMMGTTGKSRNRLSIASSRGGAVTRGADDDDARTAVKVGE